MYLQSCRSLEETYGTLEELRKEGKFKYIGISEPSAETLRKAAKVCDISSSVTAPWRNRLTDFLNHMDADCEDLSSSDRILALDYRY